MTRTGFKGFRNEEGRAGGMEKRADEGMRESLNTMRLKYSASSLKVACWNLNVALCVFQFYCQFYRSPQFGFCFGFWLSNKVYVCVGGFLFCFGVFFPPALIGPLQHASVVSVRDWSVCEATHRWSNRLASHPRGVLFPQYNAPLPPTKLYVDACMLLFYPFQLQNNQCHCILCLAVNS